MNDKDKGIKMMLAAVWLIYIKTYYFMYQILINHAFNSSNLTLPSPKVDTEEPMMLLCLLLAFLPLESSVDCLFPSRSPTTREDENVPHNSDTTFFADWDFASVVCFIRNCRFCCFVSKSFVFSGTNGCNTTNNFNNPPNQLLYNPFNRCALYFHPRQHLQPQLQ